MGQNSGRGEFETDLLVAIVTQEFDQMAQIAHWNAIDFADHRAIGVVIAFSNSMRKQRRRDDDKLLVIKCRPVLTPYDQWTWPPAERTGPLVAEPFEVVLGCLRKYERPKNEIARIGIQQVWNYQLPLRSHRQIYR